MKSDSVKSTLICSLFLSFLLLESCTIAKVSGRGPVPILYNQPVEKMTFVEHVKVKKSTYFNFTNSIDVSEVFSKKLKDKKPDAIINTSITIKSSVENFLVNLITLGIANSRKFVIEADLMEEIEERR